MGGVVKFEELNIWQEARRIVKEIYQNTASLKIWVLMSRYKGQLFR